MIPDIIDRAVGFAAHWLNVREPDVLLYEFEDNRYWWSGWVSVEKRTIHLNARQSYGALWAVFHEMVHIAQQDRGEHVYINYACILKEEYWKTYFEKPWAIEREAYDVGARLYADFLSIEGEGR